VGERVGVGRETKNYRLPSVYWKPGAFYKLVLDLIIILQGHILIPILQIGKVRLKEEKAPAQGHGAGSWNWYPFLFPTPRWQVIVHILYIAHHPCWMEKIEKNSKTFHDS
jgi:hypothetical protein